MNRTQSELAEIEDHFENMAGKDGLFAIAFALLQLVEAQQEIAYQIKKLGNADAATPMGAIEAFGAHIGEKLDALAGAVSEGNGR
jgi:hypothetical protein